MTPQLPRTIQGTITIEYYSDGHIQVTGPQDFLMMRHIMNAAERVILEQMFKARKSQEQAIIERPGLRHIVAMGKN